MRHCKFLNYLQITIYYFSSVKQNVAIIHICHNALYLVRHPYIILVGKENNVTLCLTKSILKVMSSIIEDIAVFT